MFYNIKLILFDIKLEILMFNNILISEGNEEKIPLICKLMTH